jgi:aminopeptidase N
MAVGPFATASGAVPPTPQRAQPLPIRIVATKPNSDKLEFAQENTGPIVALLERYFDRPFPFPKLDQIGSPVMPGAMENAGADTYGDDILLLDKGASTAQKQEFGMVVAHELSHQWFGDLVTPAWWDDIWLNESFANWMGYRIGNEWRPDLKIDGGAIEEALSAMDVDALQAGRPIHQHIRTNGEIGSAFDAVTYGKGGQVVAMIAAYLGDEKFRDGVRLHINRRAYGNATTDDFFSALADAAHDPRVVTAMKSFVDQQGVPVVRVERTATGLSISQKRYAMLGSKLADETWTIPMCVRVGAARQCAMLDGPATALPLTASGAIMPNAGGAGYYRFSLPDQEWRALIDEAPSLSPGEALAMTDSLWAAFRAGEASPQLLIDAARRMAANPYSQATTGGGWRLAGLRQRGMIPDASLPAYRSLIRSIYAPRLAQLGFDPRAGAYAAEDPDTQKLRAEIVALLAVEARDEGVRAKLADAARAYLGGDKAALDQSIVANGLAAWVAAGGEAAVSSLFDRAATSDDTFFRRSALSALGRQGDAATGRWLLGRLNDPRLTSQDKLALLYGLATEPATRELAFDWLKANYEAFAKAAGVFQSSGLSGLPGGFCSVQKAQDIETALRPFVQRFKQGALTLDRTVERVRDCGVLEQAEGAELTRAISAAAQ